MFSSLSVALVYSYFAKNDMSVQISREELLGAGIVKLMVLAGEMLPHGVRAAAAVKIERRWVANTLPNHELLQSMIYVYSRYRQACIDLAQYLEVAPSPTVPSAEDIGEGEVHERRVSYVKFSDKESYSTSTKRVNFDRNITPPAWLKNIDRTRPVFEVYCEMAEQTFLQFGNHLAMVFLFAKDGTVIQHLAFTPFDQVDKFIFWRDLSEQILYMRAESLIFISESWTRRNPGLSTPIAEVEIIGERLHVHEIRRTGETRMRSWDIKRAGEHVSLVIDKKDTSDNATIPNFFVPVQDAFARIHAL